MEEAALTEAAEEILAALWLARDERAERSAPRDSLGPRSDQALRELLEVGLAELHGDQVSLTTAGERQGASVVRRERLAERLLADVLQVGDALATETACRFEHILRKGVDDEICTLLGHPRVCPHGSAIPPGPCCREGTAAAGKVVSSLADLSPGEGGVIAYIQSERRDLMQRLLAMGAIPGAPVVLRQRTPSFVMELGQTQIAVDQQTARDIYVRLTGSRSASSAVSPRRGRPFRFRFRRGRHRR